MASARDMAADHSDESVSSRDGLLEGTPASISAPAGERPHVRAADGAQARGPAQHHHAQHPQARPQPGHPGQHPQQAAGGRPQQQPQPTMRPLTAEELEEERQLELKYGAEQVLGLILPVSFCMVIVIATIRSVSFFSTNDTQFAYTPYRENNDSGGGERFAGALLNVMIVIGIVIFMTFILVILYKYRCYRAIHGWLILSSLLLLFYFSYEYITQVLSAQNLPIDWITLAITIWNFGCVGMYCIHWKGPLLLQQAYLIAASALMALVLIKNLPDWSTWILLGAIAIYDLVAVLCPCGPLRMLVETAQERNEQLMPALIYSSTMLLPIITMADRTERVDPGRARRAGEDETKRDVVYDNPAMDDRTHRSRQQEQQAVLRIEQQRQQQRAQQAQQQGQQRSPQDVPPGQHPEEEEDEPHGVKLGLGDFIFYSVLVGKAATSDDWGTIFACYVAILIGLACTLLLLSIFQKALPALPISIFFGLIFYFTTSLLISPWLDQLAADQVFI